MSTPISTWDDLLIPPQARRRGVTLNLFDQLSAYRPQRPGAYLRISSDRFGLEAGVDRQQEDTEDTRDHLRWSPFARVYRENDTSAFKKRKVVRPDGSIDWVVIRPKFRQLLADLAAGVIDGVVFYDLDRLVRQPRDLEDLIDIIEYVQRPAVGATGGRMNLINDNDRHMARMMCVMALKSSEDSSRRVARMHLAAAQQGKIQGRIAYGWIRTGADKGKVFGPEAAVVRDIFAGCLFGQTAYSIATDLNRRNIASPTGRSWSSTMVNKMLRNPRYAGMVSYGGKHRVDPATDWDGWSRVLFDEEGHPLLGCWDPIIDPQQWSQVQFELQLRRQKAGIAPGTHLPAVSAKYLLSGILRCGKCQRGLVGHYSKKDKRRNYRCPPSAHGGCGGTCISAITAEEAVEEAMATYFSRLLAAREGSVTTDGPRQDLTELQATLAGELARKQALVARWNTGTLTEAGLTEEDFFQLVGSLNRKISSLQETLTANAESSSPPRMAVDAAGWRNGTVNQRRTLMRRYLHGIRVLPPAASPGGNPAQRVRQRLRPTWKTTEELAT
ncbi:MAG: recombinase family protein [Actinomycetia bacterium]|nr:recombinase family protein [Actinomycetes bacterium]